jgi:hypothetical protein
LEARVGIEHDFRVLPNPCLTNASPYQTLGSSVSCIISANTQIQGQFFRIPPLSSDYPKTIPPLSLRIILLELSLEVGSIQGIPIVSVSLLLTVVRPGFWCVSIGIIGGLFPSIKPPSCRSPRYYASCRAVIAASAMPETPEPADPRESIRCCS